MLTSHGSLADSQNCDAAPPIAAPAGSPVAAHEVTRILELRKRRGEFFPSGLFADPAWDMLLYLYSRELSGLRTTVGRLANASQVPSTTALRWIDVLIREELCVRRPDPLDARRQFVSLTDDAREALVRYFQSVRIEDVPI